MVKWTLIGIIAGFFLDLLIGDPRWLYHPIRLVGNLIAVLEKVLRKCFPVGKRGERIGGFFLVLLVVVITGGVTAGLIYGAFHIHEYVGLALMIIMSYQILATRALKDESMKVYEALETGDLERSRYAVSMIVGRDTKSLTEEGVTKATVETVAENASDGVIAPLFYLMIGGPILGFMYKAVNTMDSMVGYKNEKYRYFGTCAALFDDIVNYIPARLSGLIMILAAFFVGMDGKQAFKIFRRDRYNHASPNSAQTEAVMAGALHIQLAGNAWYFGKLYEKPTIGDSIRPIEKEDIPRSNRLLYASALLALLLFGALRFFILKIF